MMALNIWIELGLLWWLITYFTGSLDAGESYREAWIVIFGVMLVSLVANAALGEAGGIFALPLKVLALYYLIGWACDTDRKTTRRICGWYLLGSLAVRLADPSLV